VIRRTLVSALVLAGLLVPPSRVVRATSDQLAPTVHPPLPGTASELWLVPSDDDVNKRALAAYQPLVDGAARYAAGDYAAALPLVSRPSLASTPLADYAAYYTGLTQLRLSRTPEARATFHALTERKPAGYLAIGAALGEAEAAETVGDFKAAMVIYAALAESKISVNDEVLSRLGRAALAAGERRKAAEAFYRVYFEYSLTDAAVAASMELEKLQGEIDRTGYKSNLGRAQVLFGARRYSEARTGLAAIQSQATGDDRELIDLRIAECDFFGKRYQAALDQLRPYVDSASRKAEARFFTLSALRELGNRDAFIAQTRALVTDFPDSTWSEEALNNLGTYYIVGNEDDLAADAFRELYEKFPNGTRAERAAWKYGWWRYKTGAYAETVRVFESAASTFARSDYRPSFLYWAARAHAKLGEGDQADARLRLVRTDYGNSYYGRLAGAQLSRQAGMPIENVVPAVQQSSPVDPTRPPPTEKLIRVLLAAGLYDDALNELRYAQRAWGSSPQIDATIAWVYHQKGELRRAISLMRRAYPQHLTANGQEVPAEILQVIFPLTYWDSIRRHSAARDLDPYVVAALIAQESTFDAKVRSNANAWGLMQIVPSTGRRLARTLGIKRFSTATLTDPEANIRMGTLYFSKLIEQFGGTYYALASYNAGESRVVRWKAERPGLDQDEFIDDIPFPETQNYVKRILGTAEDYRQLYGKGGGRPIPLSQIAATTGPQSSASGSKAGSTKSSSTPSKKAPAKKPSTKKKPSPKR
jgi:soluble lytic murein transglycosylase